MRGARAGGACPAPVGGAGRPRTLGTPPVVTSAAARPAPRRRRYPSAARVLLSAHWRSSMSSTIGPCSATRATSASSTSTSSNSGPGESRTSSGSSRASAGIRHASRSTSASASRSAVARGTYGRCRSSSEQLARPTRTPSSSPTSSSSNRVFPNPASPSIWISARSPSRACRTARTSVSISVVRPRSRSARPAVSLVARRIGRGSSEWTSSWRITADSSARVSPVGSSPSSSSRRIRKLR